MIWLSVNEEAKGWGEREIVYYIVCTGSTFYNFYAYKLLHPSVTYRQFLISIRIKKKFCTINNLIRRI